MPHRLGSIVLALLLPIASPASAAPPNVDRADVPTGILYDLVVPLAHLERFDGSAGSPPANAATLRQAVFELARASLDPTAWPDAHAFRDDGGPAVHIGLVDLRYDRIRETARRSGAARVEGDRLVLEPGALETARAFLAAPVRGYTYRGADLAFVLDRGLFVGDAASLTRVEI
ncbi:MAG TPA: hypothetical protein VEC56_12715, partial [Candidatus Krumholzibacteria bacterium]|nr:hypothetical protein [Candidatus Krumholzibacteria bacterium]